ncbi:nitrate reductase [Actinobacillus delphinicola]|uniref:nitrate reductase (quinone) n=1 Tax=Actinobacillus delphinicola TaxID=51161 RepID=A0A448TV29_9PAST|nr:respiratory nitrate reductase subunit gamma [Actinobacillus delphinicola]MDG6897922.1 nitrate reductase [Actinobacillus delphinicola]VEJ09788.1 Respiratory nitrate reductase 1 gamma chain [Actinobacillus delphinicola]
MHNLNLFLFGVYPYIAIAVCIVGCIIRYDAQPYNWRAGSSQMLSKKGTVFTNNLFHIGILLIVIGHTFGLLTPKSVYEKFVTPEQHQIFAMVAGGTAGTMVFIGLILLMLRRWREPRVNRTSSTGDKIILWLLLAQVVLGLMTLFVSYQHLDGITLEHIENYFQSFFYFGTFQSYEGIENISIIYKAHIILGFTLILIIPFSRLHHALSAPIWYFGRRYQIVRTRFALNKSRY